MTALVALVSATALTLGMASTAAFAVDGRVKSIVFVHGGFANPAGWEGVNNELTKNGYDVDIVQYPTISLEYDVAMTRRVIAQAKGPVVLVGHSYGGAVITQAGKDPKVAGLVSITAFAPDKGESVGSLIANSPARPRRFRRSFPARQDGFLFLDKAKMPQSFAADVKPDLAAFMADTQVPWGIEVVGAKITAPAWRVSLTWYLVATEESSGPQPDAQRSMSKRAGSTVVEGPGGRRTVRLEVRGRREAH